ncbi:MAG: DNA alkylation repair protein [Bacilli bacterium]
MPTPYCCPNCKTNRTRFNRIMQQVTYVKMDPHSRETLTSATDAPMDALQMSYNGPTYRVQCGVCGLTEDEHQFIRYAESHPSKQPM